MRCPGGALARKADGHPNQRKPAVISQIPESPSDGVERFLSARATTCQLADGTAINQVIVAVGVSKPAPPDVEHLRIPWLKRNRRQRWWHMADVMNDGCGATGARTTSTPALKQGIDAYIAHRADCRTATRQTA